MRAWVARHPPGTSLSIRYDPGRHDTAVLDTSDMPESGPQASDDLKAVIMFLVLSVASIAIGRVLRLRQGP